MAITKIHAIQATVNKAVDYICNPAKTDESILISSFGCSPETAAFDFKFALSKTNQADPNKAFHLIQAFMPGEVSYKKAHQIGIELADKLLEGKYSYIVATHIDKGHVHNHIIFCAADNINHEKYHDCKKTYYHIRHLNDELCSEHQLSVLPPTDQRGKTYKEWLSNKNNSSWKTRLKMLAMMILVIKSSLRLRTIKKSALPLQNSEVRRLYNKCLNEMKITRNIPVYSTAFLKSPIIVGFLKPCIYLPIHLISDYHESDMRYMLLHELQHYRHKDAIANYLMNFAGVLYWFNPFVWFALREMRNDREIACDTSVLKMLQEDDYENYGNTLINFIEKVSITPFPFAASLSGNMKQMKRRIINIASYEKPTFCKKLKGILCSHQSNF